MVLSASFKGKLAVRICHRPAVIFVECALNRVKLRAVLTAQRAGKRHLNPPKQDALTRSRLIVAVLR